MHEHKLNKVLSEEDFYLDSLGRIVIDNPEILAAVNGAMKFDSGLDDFLLNGACANAGCS